MIVSNANIRRKQEWLLSSIYLIRLTMTPTDDLDCTKNQTNCKTREPSEKNDDGNIKNSSKTQIDEHSLVNNSKITSQRFSPLLRQVSLFHSICGVLSFSMPKLFL